MLFAIAGLANRRSWSMLLAASDESGSFSARCQEASRYERRAGDAPSVTSTSRPSRVRRSRSRTAMRSGPQWREPRGELKLRGMPRRVQGQLRRGGNRVAAGPRRTAQLRRRTTRWAQHCSHPPPGRTQALSAPSTKRAEEVKRADRIQQRGPSCSATMQPGSLMCRETANHAQP